MIAIEHFLGAYMKKLLIILICLLMLVSMCSCTQVGTDKEFTESPASDFKYEFTENKKYVLITEYIGKSKNVVIPSEIEGCTVTSLKGLDVDGFIQGVFQDSDIETVVIPDTVKVIGNRAFKNCTGLSTVTIQQDSKLQTICIEAFSNCVALKTINLKNAKNLKTIEVKAFYNCTSIEKVSLPSTLETMDREAFSNCSALKSVNVPTNLKLMNFDGARFYNVPALEEIIFDDGWQNIEGYVFFSITSTVNITIPESVISISPTVFASEGSMNLYFLGDCPQLSDADRFAGNVKIYYDSNTKGWNETPLKEAHTLIPN